jgi:hypothetical protein
LGTVSEVLVAVVAVTVAVAVEFDVGVGVELSPAEASSAAPEIGPLTAASLVFTSVPLTLTFFTEAATPSESLSLSIASSGKASIIFLFASSSNTPERMDAGKRNKANQT